MKLIFQNSRGEERVIAEPTNREEISKEINKFIDDHNFKSYYTRVWEENGRLKLDCGSWSEFCSESFLVVIATHHIYCVF